MEIVQTNRCAGRTAAIPMIGLGAACCCSIEIVQNRFPDFAAVPGTAGAVLALVGVVMLFRCQVRQAREQDALKKACVRIAPYVPETTDGSQGAEILKIVLTPAGASPVANAMETPILRRHTQAKPSPSRTNTTETPLHAGRPDHRFATPATLYKVLKLGNGGTRDVDLSRRALARLEADPFVRRLSRLG